MDAIDSGLDATDENGNPVYYYNVSFVSTEKLIYRIRIIDDSDTNQVLSGEKYVVISTANETDSVTGEIISYVGKLGIMDKYLNEQDKYDIYISAAKITDSNGISAWSKEWHFGKTGIGEVVEEP